MGLGSKAGAGSATEEYEAKQKLRFVERGQFRHTEREPRQVFMDPKHSVEAIRERPVQ